MSHRRTVVPRTTENILVHIIENGLWEFWMLDLLYNGCMHDIGFRTNLTVRIFIEELLTLNSAFDAGSFCVGIQMTSHYT